MITKQLILDSYLFLRKENQTIPSETLEFMKNASLKALENDNDKDELLIECGLQLKYLSEKFGETGTSNQLMSKIKNILS